MRCSWLLAVAFIFAGCGRPSGSPLQRIVILPFEDLSPSNGLAPDASGLQWAIWDSLQAQPSAYAVMVRNRRELPSAQPARVVEGFAAAGRFRLQLDGMPFDCAGTLEDCAPRLVDAVAGQLGLHARRVPSAAALRLIAAPGGSTADFASAAAANPACAALWISWSARSLAEGGESAALAVLDRASRGEMPAYDAARIDLRRAEIKKDRSAHATALAALANASPADVGLAQQAARETAAVRDFATALAIYQRLTSLVFDPAIGNQAAYVAAFHGNRAAAARFAESAAAAAPNRPEFVDTKGEIAYFFADFAAASQLFEQAAALDITFAGGLELWKAADSARRAGDLPRAKSLLTRFLDFKSKAGAPNTLLIQAIWDWHGDAPEAAIEKLRLAEGSMERGKALFLQSLIALNRRDFSTANRIRQTMDPRTAEAAFLNSLIDGAPPPPGLPIVPEAVEALRAYLKGDTKNAIASLAAARQKMDPFTEGQWRKLDALLNNRKSEGTLPASPDDWLAVLLR